MFDYLLHKRANINAGMKAHMSRANFIAILNNTNIKLSTLSKKGVQPDLAGGTYSGKGGNFITNLVETSVQSAGIPNAF